jgi:hypothetical protein
MSDPTTPEPTYAEKAAIQDRLLDGRLAGIRAREAAGEITTREAANERVAALELHIEAVKALREEHFGELS